MPEPTEPLTELTDIELITTDALIGELMKRSDDCAVLRFRVAPGDNEPQFSVASSWNFDQLKQMCATAFAIFSAQQNEDDEESVDAKG